MSAGIERVVDWTLKNVSDQMTAIEAMAQKIESVRIM